MVSSTGLNILVRGYYGQGNLGDDLLCMAAIQFLNEKYPYSHISILSYGKDTDYLHQLSSIEITVVNKIDYELYDLVVFGGGGVFFDFEEGSKSDRLMNGFFKVTGLTTYSRVYNQLRAWKSGVTKLPRHIAIGVGIGEFTKSSKKFKFKIPELFGCTDVFVRDQISKENADKMGMQNACVNTDLAFYLADQIPKKQNLAQFPEKVTFILRDWKYDNSSYLNEVGNYINTLSDIGVKIDIVTLDTDDKKTVQFAEEYKLPISIWKPEKESPFDFINRLRQSDLVFSSRAHGLIIASCIGIPSLGLNIEEKIETIASMLPNSVGIMPRRGAGGSIFEEIKSFYSSCNSRLMEEDIKRNVQLLRKMVF